MSAPRALTAVLGAALAAGLLAAPAAAGYRLCNETSYVLDSAIGYESEEAGWESQGWFRLYPGRCREILEARRPRPEYYVHARSIAAHQGPRRIFGGNEILCTAPETEDFHIRGRVLCHATGNEKADFLRVGGGRRAQAIFSSDRHYETRRHALISGVQRLLWDNGFQIGDIDGYAGRVTLNAVKAFQRQAGLRPTGVISDRLFEKLIAAAEARPPRAGLRLCNETAHRVWWAVGYKTTGPDPEYESKGWLRARPGQCLLAIRGKLGRDHYYVYAEAVDAAGTVIERSGHKLVRSGAFAMCVKRPRFRIAGRESCARRGLAQAPFRRIDTGGQSVWTETWRIPQEQAGNEQQ